MIVQSSIPAVIDVAVNGQCVKFRWTSNKRCILVDQITAAAICSVYNVVERKQQEKMERMVVASPAGFLTIAEFCLKRVCMWKAA